MEYQAKAIGGGSEGAQITLQVLVRLFLSSDPYAFQDKYRADFTLSEAESLSLDIMKQVMEESKLTETNVEMASVTARGFHLYTSEELQAVIARI